MVVNWSTLSKNKLQRSRISTALVFFSQDYVSPVKPFQWCQCRQFRLPEIGTGTRSREYHLNNQAIFMNFTVLFRQIICYT